MAAQYTQRAVINTGFTDSPVNSFTDPVTSHNTVIVCFWGADGSDLSITGVTDSEGNSYTELVSIQSGAGNPLQIWVAFDVIGGSNFTVTGTGAEDFWNVSLFEYSEALAASVRVVSSNRQVGGTPVIPNTTLAGAAINDLTLGMAYTTNFSLAMASGEFGSNPPTSTTSDLDSSGGGTDEGWLILEGNADGSPMLVTFGPLSDDFYGALAVAFIPSESSEETAALFMGSPTLVL